MLAITGAVLGPAATAFTARTVTSYRVNFFRPLTFNFVEAHPCTVAARVLLPLPASETWTAYPRSSPFHTDRGGT